MRSRLGESLGTVRGFDTPLEQATTSSLEALQAYTLGQKDFMAKSDFAASVPLFQRAISLDPDFAVAYNSLASGELFESRREHPGGEERAQGHELRGRVTER